MSGLFTKKFGTDNPTKSGSKEKRKKLKEQKLMAALVVLNLTVQNVQSGR